MTDPLAPFLRNLEVVKNASPHTLRSYLTDLRQFFAYLASDAGRSTASTGAGAPPVKIQTVDTRQVRGWLASLHGRGLDAASIARKLAAVRSWMRFLARRWHLERNPARDVRGPRLGRKLVSFLPTDESQALFDAGDLGVCDRAVLELLYATGLRVSELAGLTLADVDTETRTVRAVGKGRKQLSADARAPPARNSARRGGTSSPPQTAGPPSPACPGWGPPPAAGVPSRATAGRPGAPGGATPPRGGSESSRTTARGWPGPAP